MLSSYANCIANFAVGDQRLKGQGHRCLIFYSIQNCVLLWQKNEHSERASNMPISESAHYSKIEYLLYLCLRNSKLGTNHISEPRAKFRENR